MINQAPRFRLGDFRVDVRDASRRIVQQTPWSSNTLMRSWVDPFVRCVFLRDDAYRANVMYVEFENLVNPILTSTPPDFDQDDLFYYQALAGSGTRDYLRVPIEAAAIADLASDDASLLYAGLVSRVEVHAVAASGPGVHGKPFTDIAGSIVCGAAIVAAPDLDDPARDVLIARAYFPEEDQIRKPVDPSQVVVRFRVNPRMA